MVFMKKGATPSKTPQLKKGKKAVQVKEESDDEMDFDGMDDSDDDDSDEAPQLQKTPANKGAKGRQSMSEKKVSFSIPGNNSPAVKTPKKDNSILVKKQPTPANKGKTAMQEFKGMKGKNQTKKEMEDDDDDDDDDEDDDDFDVEEGDEDDDLDLDDLEEGGDDEDDDDDDEDDDEDDDDDEEGDQDQANIEKKLAMLKKNNVQQNKQKTPVKGNDKAKNAESPKEKSPKREPEQKSSPKKNPVQVTEELERRRQRDARMLFVGGLPNDIKAEELKALSSDIIDVSIPFHSRKHLAKTLFGFLCFNTEAKAESNYKSLQSKKLRGQPLSLDFVGVKSKNKKVSEDVGSNFNLKKLFVSGIPLETTIDKIAKHFPLAYQISFNQSPLFRTATIFFNSEEVAKASYESKREIEISGNKLVVLYSKQPGPLSKKRKHNRKVSTKNSFGGGMNKNSSFGGGMNKNSSFGGGMNKESPFGGKNKNSPFGGKNKNNKFGESPAKKMKFMKKSAGGDEE